MEIGTSFVADPEPFELMQPSKGPLYHPTDFAEPRAVGHATSSDHRSDAALPQQAAVLVEVVAPVGIQVPRLPARSPSQPPDRRDRVEQRQELGDVVTISAGERDGRGGSVLVDYQVVLGTGRGTVDRRGADVIPLIQCVSRRPGTMQRPGVAARTGQRMPGSPLAVKASSKSGIAVPCGGRGDDAGAGLMPPFPQALEASVKSGAARRLRVSAYK